MTRSPAEASTPIDYHWAVVRIVPRVHVEEFINVGVLLHARREERLLCRIEPDWAKIAALAPDFDRAEAERQLAATEALCRGGPGAGAIGMLPPSERFHWLTAPRSAVLQTSRVRVGRTPDLESTLGRLFEEQCGVPRHHHPG